MLDVIEAFGLTGDADDIAPDTFTSCSYLVLTPQVTTGVGTLAMTITKKAWYTLLTAFYITMLTLVS